nr:glycosyltransferase [Bacillus sp. EB01]
MAIESMFKNHKHLVWSKGYDETIELMDFYLKNDSAREKVANKGQQYVYKYHAYEQRAADAIKALKQS